VQISISSSDFIVVVPELILAACAIMALGGALLPARGQRLLPSLSLVGLGVSFAANLCLAGGCIGAFNNTIVADEFGYVAKSAALLAATIAVAISSDYLPARGIHEGEFYFFVLMSTVGMMLLVSSTDLMTIFLSLELMTICLYVLAAFARGEGESGEAGLKYLLLGAFATGFLLYGMALVYAGVGTTRVQALIEAVLRGQQRDSMLLAAGLGFMMVGFGFKLALVPFHMWAPDVYEGAPTSATAFMATGVKAAAFAALIRLVPLQLVMSDQTWRTALWVLCAATMTTGNLIALAQSNVKRMLAYSSIAHAGYMLIGVLANGAEGGAAVLFYLFAYTLMTGGAFGSVAATARGGSAAPTAGGRELLSFDDYRGLGFQRPWLSAAIAIFMLSLAGFPPTAGFFAKFYVFGSAVKHGFVGLVVVAVINSLISVYYYLRLVVVMYMEEPAEKREIPPLGAGIGFALALAAVGIIILGLFPGWLADITRAAGLPVR
jgi:NADH-quinone oxidoreductase subunit N